MSALFVVFAVLLTAFALNRWFPRATRRWFHRIATARRIIFGLGSLVLAFLFIASGATGMVIVGSLTLLFGVLFILYSDSAGVIRRWLPGV